MQAAVEHALTAPIVLLTGATGWLGRRVLSALLREIGDLPTPRVEVAKLRALVPVGEPFHALTERGVEVVQGDLRDPSALADFTKGAQDGLLIHVAGIIHPPGRTSYFDAINHLGAMSVYEAAGRAGVRRAVVISSNSPFGYNPTPDDRFTEESPFQPYMGYGRSKMKMEQALLRKIADGTSPECVILRPPWFYGPGQPPRQTLFFTMIKKGKFPLMGTGENKRSMGYVDSLAQGILLAAAHPDATGETFWLADRRPYSMNEIISTVRAVLREDFGMTVSGNTLRVPSVVADVARLCDGALQGIGLYHQKIHVLSEMNLTITCDIEKAERILGYDPQIELREGMRRSIEWCLANDLVI